MESPNGICTSALSGLSSDDSGLLLATSDSLSSCSSNWQYTMESADSDYEKFMLPASPLNDNESFELSDDEQFNTVLKKKTYITTNFGCVEPIEPPIEFQDLPVKIVCTESLEQLAQGLVDEIISEAVEKSEKEHNARKFFSCDYSTIRRPASRNSLNSRLSSSHNSLYMPVNNIVDDSSFITSAMSHDVLDIYNVPLDSDIYSLPVDSLKKRAYPQRSKRQYKQCRKRNKEISNSVSSHRAFVTRSMLTPDCSYSDNDILVKNDQDSTFVDYKEHSVRSERAEPIHMTLQEVKRLLTRIYSSSSTVETDNEVCDNRVQVNSSTTGSRDWCINSKKLNSKIDNASENVKYGDNKRQIAFNYNNHKQRYCKNLFNINVKNKKLKNVNESDGNSINNNNNIIKVDKQSLNGNLNFNNSSSKSKMKKSDSSYISSSTNDSTNCDQCHSSSCSKSGFSNILKQTLCNIFRFSKKNRCHHNVTQDNEDNGAHFSQRALPPLPPKNKMHRVEGYYDDPDNNDAFKPSNSAALSVDFAESIHKVKDYGWYWGPISGETAEKVLIHEPDGSFIVRDSSDDHYIFSLSFKLSNIVRHVRIEHDQGNFSFGSCAKFKSHTIVDFVENAVEHSRSGRYLFFLHRRPVHGPLRVQLLHPVSRFKQIQSLQHLCRFEILKVVRRDLIPYLPLPRRMIDYLNSPHYYSELLSLPDEDRPSSSPSIGCVPFRPLNRS